ncbi:MAG: HAD hydrolase family protein [Oscillospiraceae bacterium]
MKYKIIAFDLDGTLLNDVKEIPEENLRMLRRAAECGVQLVPATGGYIPACRSSCARCRSCATAYA